MTQSFVMFYLKQTKMVTGSHRFLLYGSFVALLTSTSSSLFDNFCGEVCQKTYPSHTYKEVFGESCERGCRLYSIIELIGQEEGVNGTRESCYDNCKTAYPDESEHTTACILGCRSQNSFTDRRESLSALDASIPDMEMSHMLYPVMYLHSMYSDWVDRMTSQMCVSWSFIMQDGAGRLVIMKTQPLEQDFDDYSAYKGTSSVLETNIEPSGNTATEVLRHSQLKSVRSLGDGINAGEAEPWKHKLDDGSSSDWLTCIARKTGIPRLLLCIVILLSAVAMIWLCMSAAVTAPDQRVHQMLSIAGDLEYLRDLPEKKGIRGVHLQDFVQARPLPVKIRIEQI